MPTWQIALIVLTGTVVGLVAVLGVYWAQALCIPLALAGFLTFLLAPLVGFLSRLGLGRVPSVLLVVLAAGCALGTLVWFVGAQAKSLADEAPEYTENVKQKIESLRQITQGPATRRLAKMVEEISGALMSPQG